MILIDYLYHINDTADQAGDINVGLIILVAICIYIFVYKTGFEFTHLTTTQILPLNCKIIKIKFL